MLNLGCGQYLRNPFFPGFWGQKWGRGFCILADYTRLYTVRQYLQSTMKNFVYLNLWTSRNFKKFSKFLVLPVV